ncbi:hypothetical protein D6D18_10576 [Aureobasidium pullulans]|nr:hypothetical protein D6D18_10576 [Aureobasidium pullulans]
MSAIVTAARAMVVYQAYRERERVMSDLQHRQGMTEVEAGRQAPCMFNGDQRMVQEFMTLTDYNGRPSPMDWILSPDHECSVDRLAETFLLRAFVLCSC